MTRRDRWAKRRVVVEYFAYRDKVRILTPKAARDRVPLAIETIAHIAVPASWSAKRRNAALGTLVRVKPDFDNLSKAVCDCLYSQDSGIAAGVCVKVYCTEGDERTEVILWY